MRNVRIVTEGLNGPHDLKLGDYLYDEIEETLYVGIGNTDMSFSPIGTVYISENGTYDVSLFASAEVNVPQGDVPQGTFYIYSNGTYDIASYANVEVNVPNTSFVPVEINFGVPVNISFSLTDFTINS